MKISTIRQRVFFYAYNLKQSIGDITWSECMKRAWKLIKLVIRLHQGSVKFLYRKVDGSIRAAYGTLRTSDLTLSHGSRSKKPNFGTICYFDLEKWQYRSFRIDNFIM